MVQHETRGNETHYGKAEEAQTSYGDPCGLLGVVGGHIKLAHD